MGGLNKRKIRGRSLGHFRQNTARLVGLKRDHHRWIETLSPPLNFSSQNKHGPTDFGPITFGLYLGVGGSVLLCVKISLKATHESSSM